MMPRETEHNTPSGQAGSAHLVSLIVCVLAISSAGMIVSQSGSQNAGRLTFSSMGGTDDPPIRIHPRDKPDRAEKEQSQLPEIVPGPKRSDRDIKHAAPNPKSEDESPWSKSLVSEIRNRKIMRFSFSRTTTAYLEDPHNRIFRYVNPSNFENLEIHYVTRSSKADVLGEIEFRAPWQFLSKYFKETSRYPLSNSPFRGVYRSDEIDDLCKETRENSRQLTRHSLLGVYSGRDNLFRKDSLLRRGRDVPEYLLEKMQSSNIDEQLFEWSPLNDKEGPCEIVTILWLTGLLNKIEELNPSSTSKDQIEILITHSQPRKATTLPVLAPIGVPSTVNELYNQCFLTAVRSTLEPGVIHVCLIDYEVHKLQNSISGNVPGYRYVIQKTWSIGTLE